MHLSAGFADDGKCRDLGYDLVPIMSQNASSIDTRFGKAEDFIWQVEDICGKKIINTINDAEPIGAHPHD